MDLKEMNRLYLKPYLLQMHNIDIDANKNYQCFNKMAHNNNDKNPSMRIR